VTAHDCNGAGVHLLSKHAVLAHHIADRVSGQRDDCAQRCELQRHLWHLRACGCATVTEAAVAGGDDINASPRRNGWRRTSNHVVDAASPDDTVAKAGIEPLCGSYGAATCASFIAVAGIVPARNQGGICEAPSGVAGESGFQRAR